MLNREDIFRGLLATQSDQAAKRLENTTSSGVRPAQRHIDRFNELKAKHAFDDLHDLDAEATIVNKRK